LNANSLNSLLLLLHANPHEAAAAYRKLHTRLSRYFNIHNTDDPIALADEAMDRLARRVEAGDIAIESPMAFALGIAGHLLQEEARDRLRREKAANAWSEMMNGSDQWKQERLDQLDDCLSMLPVDRRQMLESYYEWQSGSKSQHHREFAERLGMTLNTLRNRVFRIRNQVEACLQKKSDALRKADTTSRRDRRGNNA